MGLALCLVLVLAVGSALDLTRVLLLGLVMIDSQRGVISSALDPSNIIHPYHRTRSQSKSQSQGAASARSHSSNDSSTLMDSDFDNRSSFNNYSTNTSPSVSTLCSPLVPMTR